MNEKAGCTFLCIILIVALFLCEIYIKYSDPHLETITVTEKTIGIGKSPSYLVYSKYQVYEIQDLMLAGVFISSDIYGSIEPGETYRVKVMGKRIPFLSAYKNIVAVQPVKNEVEK